MIRIMCVTTLLLFSISLASSQKHFAVLIQGGDGGQLWYDTYLMYKALKENGFDSTRIYVLYADGNEESSMNPRYDPGQEPVVDASAILSSIQATFLSLQTLMTNDDVLFVWSDGHGKADYPRVHAFLETYTTGWLRDDALASWINPIACRKKIIFMAQCNSGGFIDDLRDTNPNHPSVIVTACQLDEDSQNADDNSPDASDPLENENDFQDGPFGHSEFDYHVLNAMTGHTIVGNTVDLSEYTASAGIIPVSGIFDFEVSQDSWKAPNPHAYHPLLDDPQGISATTFLNVHMDLASFNKSKSSFATASNNQRKLYRESSGKLHEVFEGGGGAVFYRNSTTGGASWNMPFRVSRYLNQSSSPSITMSGNKVIIVWSQLIGSGFVVNSSRSLNGGANWTAPVSSPSFSFVDPGPLPAVTGYSGDVAFCVYRGSSSLNYSITSDGGGTWTSPASVPGTTSTCRNPSAAIYLTYWSSRQANLVWATDAQTASPQIKYKWYEFGQGWGSETNLTSVIPAQYAHHANPNLACEDGSGNKPVHVVWDAEDSQNPDTRVLVHRKGGFRSFGNQYSVLHYISEFKPSISSTSADAAWMVYQNSYSNDIWKRYYNGTNWSGANGTWLGNGFNPQTSVGSSSTKYIWTSGSSAPHSVNVSSETLGKTADEQELVYSRAASLIDPETGAFLTVRYGSVSLKMRDGERQEISFCMPPPDSIQISPEAIFSYASTEPFVIPPEADTLELQIAIYGRGLDAFRSESASQAALNLSTVQDGALVSTYASRVISESEMTSSKTERIAIAVGSLPKKLGTSSVVLQPVISGLKLTAKTLASLGHIYNPVKDAALAKMGHETGDQSPNESKPALYSLSYAYPNPFNPTTQMQVHLTEGGYVSLVVYDVLGQMITTLLEGYRQAGNYSVRWAATGAASGMYFARFVVLDDLGRIKHSETNKLLLSK
jgi:hypothetical protein